jgi:glycosyltransferase involved in cell wall biosynthesis
LRSSTPPLPARAEAAPAASAPGARTRNSVLAFFNHPVEPDLVRIRLGEVPTERLYGLVELLDRGWRVEPCDEQFEGRLTGLTRRFRHLGALNLRSLRRVAEHDVVLVKDEFSLPLTLLARALGKRIVYLDSLFAVPRSTLKRLLLRINVRAAPLVLCYSQHQVRLWADLCGVPAAKFRVLRYSVDWPFYRGALEHAPPAAGAEPPYVLSVGRDLGRDFDTLLRAAEGTGLRVKLVTLPYLVPAAARGSGLVDVLERVSYPELFRLYAGARMVVVPLKRALAYPSGIRAVLEALAVGRATIATRTEILREYVPDDGRNLLYVDPERPDALRAAIRRLDGDDALRADLERRGRDHIAENFQMVPFVDDLESLLAGGEQELTASSGR